MTVLTHRTGTGLALALALGALTAPGAQARPNLDPPSVNNSPPASIRVVHVADHSGFDWSDAAIGAGGMVGLIAIGAGATLAADGRRSRRSSPRPARVG
jgi:hypothetical protein